MTFSVNEHVMWQENYGCSWKRAVVVKALQEPGKYIIKYTIVRTTKEVEVTERKLARVSIWLCRSCGNWIDPEDLPKLGTVAGSNRTHIQLNVIPACTRGEAGISIPMKLVPWTEVPGVSAIGGIHPVGEIRKNPSSQALRRLDSGDQGWG